MPKFLSDKKFKNALKLGAGFLALISLLISIGVNFKINEAEAQILDPYKYSLKIGRDWEEGQFTSIYGTSVDSTGNIYLSVSGNDEYIQKYNSSGTYQSRISTSSYSITGRLVINNDFIYNPEWDHISKYALDGTPVADFASSGGRPMGLTLDASGNIYVAFLGNNVKKYDSSGTLLMTISTWTGGDGSFSQPYGVALDSSGNIYVADNGNSRVQKFDSSGTYLTNWTTGGNGRPYDIFIDGSDNIYVNNGDASNIEKYNTSGVLLATFSGLGGGLNRVYVDSSSKIYTLNKQYNSSGDTILLTLENYGFNLNGQINGANSIETDSSGNLYVADSVNYRVQKFDSSGTFLSKFGSYGSGEGQFINPKDIAFDSLGNIYVLDGSTGGANDNRIEKFTSEGVFTAQWSLEGDPINGYNEGMSIATDSNNNVYVYNRDLYAVEKFNSSGVKSINIGSQGSGDGQFTGIYNRIAIDQTNNTLYVLDQTLNRVQAFDSSGTYLRQWSVSGMSVSKSIAVKNGYVFVLGGVYYATSNIGYWIYDTNGNYIGRSWPTTGTSDGHFNTVTDLAIDSSLNGYVLGINSIFPIQKFTNDTWTTQTVFSDDGMTSSKNIDVSGNGKIGTVFSHGASGNALKFSELSGGVWTSTDVETASVYNSWSNSIDYTSGNVPYVGYYVFPFMTNYNEGSGFTNSESVSMPSTYNTTISMALTPSTTTNTPTPNWFGGVSTISSDTPAIAYYDSGEIKFAIKIGAGGNCGTGNVWYCETVKTGASDSNKITLAFDSNNTPGIALIDNNGTLSYFEKTSGTNAWTETSIEDTTPTVTEGSNISFGQPVSLAFDTSNNPMIAYTKFPTTPSGEWNLPNDATIRFSKRSSEVWTTETIGLGGFSSMTTMPNGTAAMSYISNQTGSNIIKYATRDGATTGLGCSDTDWNCSTTMIASKTASTSYEIQPLTSFVPTTTYKPGLVYVDSSGNLKFMSYYSIPANTAPNTPSGLSATPLGGPLFGWTFYDSDTGDAQSSIQMQVGTLPGSDICDTGKISYTSQSITYQNAGCTTELTPGNTYYYRIKVWDSEDSASSYSSMFNTFVAVAIAPTAPSACVTSNIASGGMTIGWTDNSSNETYFDLEKSTDGVSYETVDNAIAANAVSKDVSSLSPNSQYWFRVRALGDSGNSTYATCSPVYTLAETPSNPTSTVLSSSTINVVINSGSNPSSTEYAINFNGQYVQANGTLNSSEVWQTKTTWGGADGITATGLTPNTTYTIKVKARNGGNTETALSSGIDRTTLAAAPSFTISEVQATSIKLTITENGNPTGTQYEISLPSASQYLGSNGNFGLTPVWQSYTEWGGASGIVITTIENTSYGIQVIAKNSDSLTAASSTSTTYTAVGAPSNFQATTINPASIAFSVDTFTNDTTGSSGYFFYGYSTPEVGGGYYSYSNWITTNTWTHDSLAPNKEFIHHIKYRNQNSVETAVVDLTTCTKANIPGTPSISNSTTHGFDITIDKNGNPDGTYYAVTSGGLYLAGDGTFNAAERWFTADATATFTVSDPTLSPSGNSLIYVKAKNCDNVITDNSVGATAYTAAQTPGTPIVTPYTTSANVKIDTNGNSSYATYHIQIATDALFTDANYVQSNGTLSGTAFWQSYADWGGISGKLVTGLTANTAYYVRIKAKNGSGTETDYASTTFTTGVATPGAPTYVSGSATTTTFRFNIDTNSNPSNTEYTITYPEIGKYLNGVGALTSDTAVWKTSTQWDAIDGNASNGITLAEFNMPATLGNTCTLLKVKARSISMAETDLGPSSAIICILANTPSVPTLSGNDSTSQLTLTINTDQNDVSTKYAIYEPTQNKYLQSDYTLGTSAYWNTKSSWESGDLNTELPILINSLSSGTSYTFKLKARNESEIETDLSSSSNAISTNQLTDGGGCTASWTYSPWSTCVNGQQSRTRTDSNGCPGSQTTTETQACACVPNWSCSDWGTCSSESQSRTCADSNNCGITTGKPAETQSCAITPLTCNAEWHYSDWSSCADGKQTRTKTDSNSCAQPSVITEEQTCSVVAACVENWACTTWSTCSQSGSQIRACTDQSVCGTTTTKPIESQTCTPACTELWECTNWSACSDNSKTRTCTDRNICGTTTTTTKPSEEAICTVEGQTEDDDSGSNNVNVTVTGEDLIKQIEELKKEIKIPSDALTRGEFLAYVVNDLNLQDTKKDYLEKCGQSKDECTSLLSLGQTATISKSEPKYKELDLASQLGLTSVFAETNDKELQTNATVTKAEAVKVILMALDLIKPQTCEELIIEAGSEEAILTQKTPFQDLTGNITKCWLPKVANAACEAKILDCGKNAKFNPDSYLLKSDFEDMIKRAKAYAEQKNIKLKLTIDADKDGLNDVTENEIYFTNPKKSDTDSDGLSDGDEVLKYKTNPLNQDSDSDTLKDSDEIKKYKTDPLKMDTDGDGFNDNIEITSKTNPNDPQSYPKDTKGVGVSDDWQTKNNISVDNGTQDTDFDGLPDKMEYQYGTDPKNTDTDNDGFTDGQEILDMHTDPLKFTTIDKIPLSITNIAQNQIIADSSFYVKGTAKSNTLVQIYARNTFGREKVIGSVSANSNNMFDIQTEPIKDGKYLLLAKAFDSKKSEVISSTPINIEINSALVIDPPSLSSFGGVEVTEEMIKSGFKITTSSLPSIRGKTEFGNEVITSWKSLLSSSALVADTPAGEFTVKPGKPLEEGEHTVTVYSVRKKDNVMSKALKLSFIVKEGLSSIDLSNINKFAGKVSGFYQKDTVAKVFYQVIVGLGAAGGVWLLIFLIQKYRDYKAYAEKMRKRKEKGEDEDEEDEE